MPQGVSRNAVKISSILPMRKKNCGRSAEVSWVKNTVFDPLRSNCAETVRRSYINSKAKNKRQCILHRMVKTASSYVKGLILKKIFFIWGVIPKNDIEFRSSRDCAEAIAPSQLGQKPKDAHWGAAFYGANRIFVRESLIFLSIFVWSQKCLYMGKWVFVPGPMYCSKISK